MRGDMSVNNDNLRQSVRSNLRSNAHNGYLNKPHESLMGYSLFFYDLLTMYQGNITYREM
ncbi:hypothetical protein DKG79_18480 [Escherichia fergusonii]|nr:hypothetical protein DKG79_18480 [Escherichia fergusonii]